MKLQEIIDSLRDQARDKEHLANGDKESIFTQDASMLWMAAEILDNVAQCGDCAGLLEE